MGTEVEAETTDRDRTAAELLAELGTVAAALAEVPKHYARRVELFDQLRKLDPPVPFDAISEVDGASPEACRVALLKKRRADEGNPISRKTKKA